MMSLCTTGLMDSQRCSVALCYQALFQCSLVKECCWSALPGGGGSASNLLQNGWKKGFSVLFLHSGMPLTKSSDLLTWKLSVHWYPVYLDTQGMKVHEYANTAKKRLTPLLWFLPYSPLMPVNRFMWKWASLSLAVQCCNCECSLNNYFLWIQNCCCL